MRRKAMLYFISIVIIIVTTTVFVAFASTETDVENVEFLRSFGWEVQGKAIEKTDIIIPNPFDRVYENYNKIQIEAGLDLRPYRGMNAVRYTYIIGNYPVDVGEDVRANVICVDGKAVGGDIMTVSINGFMHSLKYDNAIGENR